MSAQHSFKKKIVLKPRPGESGEHRIEKRPEANAAFRTAKPKIDPIREKDSEPRWKDKSELDGRFMSACKSGNLEAVRYYLEKGADIECPFEKPYPPIHLAVLGRNIEVVEFLLERGANKDEVGRDFGTPLAFAVKHGLMDIAVLLIEKGADVDLASHGYPRTPYSDAPLVYATENESLEFVELLLKKSAKIYNSMKDFLYRKFYDAAQKSDIEGAHYIYNLIVESGKRDFFDPLFGVTLSINAGSENLLEHFLDAEKEKFEGEEGAEWFQTIFRIALYEESNARILRMLLLKSESIPGVDYSYLLRDAVNERNTDGVRLLLDYGADPRAQAGYGRANDWDYSAIQLAKRSRGCDEINKMFKPYRKWYDFILDIYYGY
jgi:ankyrin repeat protein